MGADHHHLACEYIDSWEIPNLLWKYDSSYPKFMASECVAFLNIPRRKVMIMRGQRSWGTGYWCHNHEGVLIMKGQRQWSIAPIRYMKYGNWGHEQTKPGDRYGTWVVDVLIGTKVSARDDTEVPCQWDSIYRAMKLEVLVGILMYRAHDAWGTRGKYPTTALIKLEVLMGIPIYRTCEAWGARGDTEVQCPRRLMCSWEYRSAASTRLEVLEEVPKYRAREAWSTEVLHPCGLSFIWRYWNTTLQ